MTRLAWDQVGERFFETGVDRGVLYTGSELDGVVWNGLVAVSEEVSGGEVQPFYFDGLKFLDVASGEDFQATVEAFSAPDEFALCDGRLQIVPGLFATNQPRATFGFSYRTLIGNDLDGEGHGYKLHLVYNATAVPSPRSNSTLSNNPEATPLSWTIHTVPMDSPFYKPTAHLIVDTRYLDPFVIQDLENRLYGSDVFDPRLPTQGEVANYLSNLITEPLTEPI